MKKVLYSSSIIGIGKEIAQYFLVMLGIDWRVILLR